MTKLNTYRVIENDAENTIMVNFEIEILGQSYSAIIGHGFNQKCEWTIRISYGKVVKYSEKLKKQ